MGKKIFISYKYGDSNVAKALHRTDFEELYEPTTARHYVDYLQSILESGDHINKGEKDGEDLSAFKDSTIESRLRNKIWDSSLTIVLISPNMKDTWKSEDDQWIPWEIAYSLKEHTRNGRTSKSNAVLAVVLPDKSGYYSYFIQENHCTNCSCRILSSDVTFKIIISNMFNKKGISDWGCTNSFNAVTIYPPNSSYIGSVKWCDFIANPSLWINVAEETQNNIDSYDLKKIV